MLPAELLSILFAELLMMLPAEEQALETAESLPPVPVGVGDDDGATEQERVGLGLGRWAESQRSPLAGGLCCGVIESTSHLPHGLLPPEGRRGQTPQESFDTKCYLLRFYLSLKSDVPMVLRLDQRATSAHCCPPFRTSSGSHRAST